MSGGSAPRPPCVSCGAALSSADRFCPRCGRPTASTPAPAIGADLSLSADPWSIVVERLRQFTQGEYEILRELGRGGMAAVYLAHERALNRKVAVKVMSPSLLAGEGMVERFRQEAVTVANLSHPHIVTIHAVRQAEELHFFTMKFVEGRSLDHIVHAAGALPVPIVRALLFMIGSALGYAHRRGVVHRDVKPGNVLLDGEGNAVVTDFGIAKVAQDAGNTQHLTQTGTLIGTPTYISPEQCYAQPVSAASDQYSLGVVAYELLTGRPPFSGSSFMVMQAHTERPVPPLRDACPDCPPEFEAAVLRMLEKDPAARWPSMQHALAALDARPLAEHDPIRDALARFATSGTTPPLAIASVPRPDVRASDVVAPPPAPYVVAVAILAPPDAVEVGDTIVLSATARSSSGSTMPGARLRWDGDAPEVATVDETRGVVHALAPGEVTIGASAEGVRGTVTVRVVPRRVAAVHVSTPPGAIRVGERVRLVASAVDKREAPLSRAVSWLSAEPEFAEVGADGVLTARRAGAVLVWAEADGVRGSAQLEIAPAAVAALALLNPPTALEAEDSAVLVARATDAEGNELAGRGMTWSTSDRAVASVSGDGRVEARAAGEVTIRCACEGVVAEHRLEVRPASVETVRVSRAAGRLTPGRRVRVSAQVIGKRGQVLDRRVDWYTSAPDVAAVSPEGVVSLRGPGEVTIVAVTEGGQGTLTFEVPAPTAEELARAARWRRRWRRDVPAAAATALLLWGGVRGVAALRARPEVARDRPVVDTSTVKQDPAGVVQASAPARVVVARPGDARAGDTLRLVADVFGRDGEKLTAPVAWRSTNERVAVVREDRLVAVAPGETRLVATSGTVADSVALTVGERATAATPFEIQSPARLTSGETARLQARGGDPAVAVRWRSSNAAVAVVDQRGQVRALAPGVTELSAQRGTSRATARVVVEAPAAVATPEPQIPTPRRPAVAQVVVSASRTQVPVGESVHLTAVVRAGDGAVLTDRALSWSVSSSDVATVDSLGTVTARAPGAVRVYAKSEQQQGEVEISVARPTPPPPRETGTDAAAAARTAAAEFVAAVRAGNVARVTALMAAETRDEERARKQLLDYMARPEANLRVGEPQPAPEVSPAAFRVAFTRRTPVGAEQASTGTFRVESSGGVARVRLVGSRMF